MEFLVNGKVMSASVIDVNGTDCTNDFIGNSDGFTHMVLVDHPVYGDIWSCDPHTFGFWSWACESQTYVNLKKEELKNEGVDLTDALADVASSDLEDTLKAEFALVYEKAVELELDF